MKLIFSSLLFLLASTTYANLVQINYTNNIHYADSIKEYLMAKFNIPENFIKIEKSISECHIKKESILHLCLNKNDQLVFINLDQKKVIEVLGVFYE